jgi:alkylation response protein AidB-like acyl-CoA dehydrogenase
MSAVRQNQPVAKSGIDTIALVNELGPRFAARAAEHDASDAFVAENYAELKGRGAFAAGIPEELGGGGASYPELCAMLGALARYCSSTALALSMHTHLVASVVWRWRRDPKAVEGLLRRIVNERLVLISTGASDWLNGSGRAERVDGGWRVNARKIFGSGVPAGDFLITGAVCDDPETGATVLHFPLSLKADGVRILDTWYVMGMRATGSHDVAIEDAFEPDTAISGRRPQGKWHLLMHVAATNAFPIVYSVYLGISEAARDLAIQRTRERGRSDADV